MQIDADHLDGGRISVRGDVSSQFLSALLLSAPCMDEGLRVSVATELVSRPYVDMTLAVMDAFGAHSTVGDDDEIAVLPTGYRACERYVVEPDASAASYFFAAAAIRGGTVRVEGLGTASLQGDVAFVDALERMGARVRRSEDTIEVTRHRCAARHRGRLRRHLRHRADDRCGGGPSRTRRRASPGSASSVARRPTASPRS